MFQIGYDTAPPVISASLTAGIGELQSVDMTIPRVYWDEWVTKPEYAYVDGYGGHIETVSMTATQVTLTAQSYAGAEMVSYSRLSPVSTAGNVSTWLEAMASALDGDAEISGNSQILASKPHTANLAAGMAFSVLCSMAANYGLDCFHSATTTGDVYRFTQPGNTTTEVLVNLITWQRAGSKPKYDYAVINKLAQVIQKETIEYDPRQASGVQYTTLNQPYLTGTWNAKETQYTPSRLIAADKPEYVRMRSQTADSYVYRIGGSGNRDLTWATMAPMWGKLMLWKNNVSSTYTADEPVAGDGFVRSTRTEDSESYTVFECIPGIKKDEPSTLVSQATQTETTTYSVDTGTSQSRESSTNTEDLATADCAAKFLMLGDGTAGRADVVIGHSQSYYNEKHYAAIRQESGTYAWGDLFWERTINHSRVHTLKSWATTDPQDFPWLFAIRRIAGVKYSDCGNATPQEGVTYPEGSLVNGIWQWAKDSYGNHTAFVVTPTEVLYSADFDDTYHPTTIDPNPPHDISLPKDDDAFFDPEAEIDWKWQFTNLLSANIVYQLQQATTSIKLTPTATNAIVTARHEASGQVHTYQTTGDFDLTTTGATTPVKVTLLASDAASWSTADGDEEGNGYTLTSTVWASKTIGEALVPIVLWQQARADEVSVSVPMAQLSTEDAIDMLGKLVQIGDNAVYITNLRCDYSTEQISLTGYVKELTA